MAQDSIAAPAETAKAPMAQRFRIPIALVALLAWIVITSLDPFHEGQPNGFIGALTYAPAWGILFAGLFLIALIALFRWRDLGLNRPRSSKSLLLLWLPAIYLVLFFALDIAVGPPPLATAGFLLLNTVLAAVSEELMFRGVLLSALRTRLRLWLAITVTTLLFGLAHLLNLLVIGDLATTSAQAVAAAMSGVLFIAIRVRTGSLFPAMAFHALWDFGMLMAIARLLSNAGTSAAAAAGSAGTNGAAAAGSPSLMMLLVPIALLLPNFLYALFLLRRGDPETVIAAAAS